VLQFTSENEPATAKSGGDVIATEAQSGIREAASQLKIATDRLARCLLTACGASGAYVAFKIGVKLIDGPRGLAPQISGGIALIIAVVFGVIVWRTVGLRVAKEQERVLRELQQLGGEDPLALEAALPELKRVTQRFPPRYGPSAAIAGDLISSIEQARAASRDLPIAHHADPEVQDNLPRAV
jgi:hypothetical protein